jgi:hypothetical protein
MRPLFLLCMIAIGAALSTLHARQPVHTWFIFVDDLHVAFTQTGRLRSLVDAIATELIHDGAMYAVAVSGPSQVAIDLTNDLTRLRSAVKTLTGNALRADDVAQTLARGSEPNEVSYRLRVALGAIRDALSAHIRREGPPSTVVFVSSGYFDSPTYREQWANVVRPLITSDTEVFAADPRRPDGTLAEVLERVTLSP